MEKVAATVIWYEGLHAGSPIPHQANELRLLCPAALAHGMTEKILDRLIY